MFLHDSWYVAAWSRELTDQLFARTLLDRALVMHRLSDCSIATFEDRCPHRHLPLSMGRKCGDVLQCGYHGLRYDASGACIFAPSQKQPPKKAQLKAYPTVERYGWIWVWMGDPARADDGLIPDFHRLTDPAYAAVGATNLVRANYRLINDNLLDLSHVGTVHVSTIGNAEMGGLSTLTHARTERGVRVTRLVQDVPPPPTYLKTGLLPEGRNIDRWQVIDYIAPCFVHIHVGGAETGTGVPEGRTDHGLNFWVINAMTPETEASTHYFWASVRTFAIGVPEVDALVFTEVGTAFDEDKVVIEAQQKAIAVHGDSWGVPLKADAGSIEARRLLERLILEEQPELRSVTR